MNRIIDAHLHFWELDRFEYRWLKPDTPLYRNFMPDDIADEAKAHGVEGCVLIEAANTSAEIPWLLQMAEQHSMIKGVVGSIDDFGQPTANSIIQQYADYSFFKGVRLGWFDSRGDAAELASSFQALAAHELSCDILSRQFTILPEIEAVARKYPGVTFILNHMAGATLTPGEHIEWENALRTLAALPNIAVKMSGFLIGCDPKPLAPTTLADYLETALELFGAERLMYASNFPINVLVSAAYSDAITFLEGVMAQLSSDEQAQLWGDTARRLYRL